MKKLVFILILLMLPAMMGCGRQSEVLDALEGSWYCSDQTLTVRGNQIEVQGFYELDGRRMPGVITVGKIKARKDGFFTVTVETQVLEGRLTDDGTLILGGTEYRR